MEGQVVRCAKCGQANRVPPLGSGKKAVCGKCGASLDSRQPPTANRQPVTLTDATFREAIAREPFVVDFWAAWCGPCRMVSPIIDALASERSDVSFGKLNVDENPRTAAAFGVQGIPLLVFFRDGKEAGRVVGAVPKGQIEAAMQRYLGG
jgi:thioredoxin